MRQKSLVKTVWKRAFRACERAMIAAVNRRDKVCQLCKSDFVLQADHAIVSRKHLSTFFEIRQMVLLCRTCHGHKTWKNFGTEVRVAEIVRKREGVDFINWVQQQSRQIKKWSVEELENMTEYFKGVATNGGNHVAH